MSQTGDPDAWTANADRLAGWAMLRLVNRADRGGGHSLNDAGVLEQVTRPQAAKAGFVNQRLLARHFRASAGADVVGLHALGPDSVGKWAAVDVDNHEDDGHPADPAANLAFALDLYAGL